MMYIFPRHVKEKKNQLTNITKTLPSEFPIKKRQNIKRQECQNIYWKFSNLSKMLQKVSKHNETNDKLNIEN